MVIKGKIDRVCVLLNFAVRNDWSIGRLDEIVQSSTHIQAWLNGDIELC